MESKPGCRECREAEIHADGCGLESGGNGFRVTENQRATPEPVEPQPEQKCPECGHNNVGNTGTCVATVPLIDKEPHGEKLCRHPCVNFGLFPPVWPPGTSSRTVFPDPDPLVGEAPERIRVNIRHGKDDWIGIAYSSKATDPSKIYEYVTTDLATRAEGEQKSVNQSQDLERPPSGIVKTATAAEAAREVVEWLQDAKVLAPYPRPGFVAEITNIISKHFPDAATAAQPSERQEVKTAISTEASETTEEAIKNMGGSMATDLRAKGNFAGADAVSMFVTSLVAALRTPAVEGEIPVETFKLLQRQLSQLCKHSCPTCADCIEILTGDIVPIVDSIVERVTAGVKVVAPVPASDEVSDALVDEVQRRMDVVVDAAVEWHKSMRMLTKGLSLQIAERAVALTQAEPRETKRWLTTRLKPRRGFHD